MIHPDRRCPQRRRQQQRSLGGWRVAVSIYYFLFHFWYGGGGGEGKGGGGVFLTEIHSFSVTSTTVRYGRSGTRTPTTPGPTSTTTTGTTIRQSWTTIWTAYHSALLAASSSSSSSSISSSSSSSSSSHDHRNDTPTVESDGTAVMTTATTTTTTTDDYHQWTVGECIGSGSYGTVHYLQAIPVMSTSSATVPPTPLPLGQLPPSLPSPQWFVGKRAWKAHEIQLPGDGGEKKANDDVRTVASQQKERQSRCMYYWKVEAHCFHKLPRHPQLPPYYGTTTIPKESKMKDRHNSKEDEWMVFGPILQVPSSSQQDQDQDVGTDTSNTLPRPPPLAQSLAHYMELDWQHSVRSTTSMAATVTATDNNMTQLSQSQQDQRLPNLAKALNCHNDASTLDTLFSSLLSVVAHIHASNIVHRDIKPSNILIAPNEYNSIQQSPGNAINRDPLLSTSTNHPPNKVILIDFGSAADLDPLSGVSSFSFPFSSGSKKYVGLDVNEQKVAVSPLYCAPEIFIDPQKAPLAFDLSSCGLLFCQFIFSYLDERSDAGFRQQLLIMANTDSSSNNSNHWDLNRWLANQLASKVRPEGLEDALAYLGERPGLWTFLQELLQKDPRDRPTSEQALQRWTRLLARAAVFQNDDDGDNGSEEEDDIDEDDQDRMTLLEREDGRFFAMVVESIEACQLPTVSRPLHFVATFSRNKPLGLVFSEFTSDDEDDDNGDDNENAAHHRHQWTEATKDAVPGEVFIKDIVPGGQADQLGIFEIGDRLQGIGELTFTAGGFEKAVEMLQDQPRSAQNVRLHFDRIKVRDNQAIPILPPSETKIAILDQGVWSTQGRRQTQEDAFGTYL
jgi:serine/threonine protein kinase